MATSPMTPTPPAGPAGNSGSPAGGSPQSGGSPASGVAAQPGAPAQKLARLAMDAQGIASENPETAPMMREIQNQVRMATMKMIQMRQASQQQTPQI